MVKMYFWCWQVDDGHDDDNAARDAALIIILLELLDLVDQMTPLCYIM